MSALPGGVISTLTDGTGAPIFTIYEWYVPFDQPNGGQLRDAVTTTSRGTQTGALIVDNQTGRSQQIIVVASGTARTFNIGPNGAALTVAQLAAQTPPITTIQDLAGIQPSVT
jgi:hypothetical protein